MVITHVRAIKCEDSLHVLIVQMLIVLSGSLIVDSLIADLFHCTMCSKMWSVKTRHRTCLQNANLI